MCIARIKNRIKIRLQTNKQTNKLLQKLTEVTVLVSNTLYELVNPKRRFKRCQQLLSIAK